MELENALDQIAQIHRQMALTKTFRGYRSATTLFTAFIAVATAVFQNWWLPQPSQNPVRFVELWICVAAGCLIVVAAEMMQRFGRTDSLLDRQLTVQAIEQFLPSLVIGGMVTFLVNQFAHESRWLLPGLWAIFFGMGILASRQLLPRYTVFVGAFYLLCGLLLIGNGRGAMNFSPWAVGIPFGIGQTAAAFILHWSLERHHEPK